MMSRPFSRLAGSPICQICEAICAQRSRPSAKRTLVTLSAGRWRAKIAQGAASRPPRSIIRQLSTSQTARDAKQAQGAGDRPSTLSHVRQELPDLSQTIIAVNQVKNAFLNQQGIPSEGRSLAALRAIQLHEERLLSADAEVQPDASSLEAQPHAENTASHLLSLDQTKGRNPAKAEAVAHDLRLGLEDVINTMAEAAYAIVAHPNVFITPQLLGEYVRLQSRLGRPETLPQVFHLYAAKPLPRKGSESSIKYVPQNPNKASNAIDAKVADAALDAAIEAKNLDAAIGIIENSFAAKAFVRSKLVRKAAIPASVFAALPVAAYITASNMSQLQNTMEEGTATSIAFAGILAYVGFTAVIAMVAVSTANDQMKRVTWAPGTPLRERWIREEERAALDKVACAFGFSDSHRYGEEDGAEFHALRRYILAKGMILDAAELMEGMNA